jgi:class 3 adenylate cyclase/tetratricopeptide (TPR) repeat protein
MSEREQLEHAIAALEAQRPVLGEAAVEAALAGLRQKLAALDEEPRSGPLQGADTGERKLITVMFADISGFTALSETMDPEAVRDLMNTCFERLVPCITRYEGVVDKFIGDEIMALFGAPLAHENDAERAVRAALDMMAALSAFNAERHTNLGLHFGINTGLALAGSIGAGQRQEYSVMGDAVNLASRLEEASERGQILVGPDTYRLTAPLFEYEVLAPIKVKGKAEPVPIYRVAGLKTQPGKVRGLEAKGISSPLVGREKEFAMMRSGVEQLVASGRGGIIGIIGDAGLGKSRLIAEAQNLLRSDDFSRPTATKVATTTSVMWLEGHTLSFGQTISYWPFQEILRGWAGITEKDDEDDAWRKLEGKVRALFGEETIEYLPYLASLLALAVRGEYVERVKYLDGEAMGKQIFLTSRRFFERLAITQPTVLVFEDLHWMDESSTHLLEHLLPLVESAPLLIVGLSRPERGTPAARLRELSARDYPARYTEIRLVPLSSPDSAQLVRNLLEIEDLPVRVREMIVGKAEGNPFFIEEVIRTLIDTGAVKRDTAAGRWRATAQIETLTIPDTIQGVIMARVDRLEEEVKQVLRTAAVVGRSFFYRVLKAVAEADKTLDASLAELQAIELIREKQVAPELEYIFKHALAQETTYESILLQRRRDLHARVGRAIESLFADRLEEFYGLLAYHYAKAETWEKAQEYLLKAGDQAGQMAADAEALNHYQQAAAAYARAFGDNWDPLQRVSLERKMGEAFYRRGEYARATECFRRGLSHLGYRLPETRWEVQRELMREMLAQVSHRLWPRLFIRPISEATHPGREDEALIYSTAAAIDAFTFSERFLLLTVRLLNISERRGYPLGVVLGAGGLGTVFDFLGLFRLANAYVRRAVDTAEKLQQPRVLGFAYYYLQTHELHLCELTQSLEHGRRAAQIAIEAGYLGDWAYPAAFIAWSYTHLGNLPEAMALSQEIIRFGRDAGVQAAWCWGEAALGYALRRQGQFQEAAKHQQKAIELAEAIPDYIYHIIAGAELSLCYLRQGDWRAALAQLETCQRIAAERRLIEPYGRTNTLNNLAEAYLFAVEHSDKSEKADWLNKSGEACRVALKQAPRHRTKWPKAMRLQGTYEWLNGKPVNARKWWHKSLAEAERTGLRYDAGVTHLELGYRLGERVHLEKAEAIFAEIGAEWDLARARELLAASRGV